MACFRPGNKASLVVLRLVYVAACLEMTNRRSGRSGAAESMALVAGRNTKSIAEGETVSVLAGPWYSQYLAWYCDCVTLRVNPMPMSRAA